MHLMSVVLLAYYYLKLAAYTSLFEERGTCLSSFKQYHIVGYPMRPQNRRLHMYSGIRNQIVESRENEHQTTSSFQPNLTLKLQKYILLGKLD